MCVGEGGDGLVCAQALSPDLSQSCGMMGGVGVCGGLVCIGGVVCCRFTHDDT